jgi:hypothetical protein
MKNITATLASLVLVAVLTACSKYEGGIEPANTSRIQTNLLSVTPSVGILPEGGDIAYNADESAIDWRYDTVAGALLLRHSNAALRNDGQNVSIRIRIEENIITVIEKQREAGSGPLDLYDVEFLITDLPVRSYRVVVIEPYVQKEQRPLSFRLDLVESLTGAVSVERTQAPWGDIATF